MDADAWDERYAAAELVWSREPNQFVAAELADLPPGTAVDLAAGEGRNAIWLAARGWAATAVDFSQVALDKGARLAAEDPREASQMALRPSPAARSTAVPEGRSASSAATNWFGSRDHTSSAAASLSSQASASM